MADIPGTPDHHDGYIENRDDIPLKETGTDGIADDEKEYPPTAKLVPILVGLCFQSFCIALVSLIKKKTFCELTPFRITPSLQRQYRKSPSSSIPLRTFLGMRARIY